MKLKITLAMDNAAFEALPGAEAARILRGLATRLESFGPGEIAGSDFYLHDGNGNRCGLAEVRE